MQDDKLEELGTDEKNNGIETSASRKDEGIVSSDKVDPSVRQSSQDEPEPSEKKIGPFSRRSFVIGTSATAILLGLGALRYAGHNPLVRPPGGQSEKYLVSACIRCERCYEACPQRVIVPAKIEDGLLGMRTPMLDFNAHNYCDFCYRENNGNPLCVSVCPTHALNLDDGYVVGNPDEKTIGDIILGKAVIDTSTCLAYRLTACRKCYDVCEYGAITLNTSSSDSANPLPEVHEDLCNGCGHCQAECLSLTTGSIKSDKVAIIVEPI